MKRLLAFLLICATVLPLAACAPKKKEENQPKVTVYGDGVVPAMIVSTVGVPSSVVDDLMTLRGTLSTLIGETPTYSSDKAGKNGVELVFGETNRAITARAKEILPTLDGDEATYVVLFNEDGAAVVWNHEYAAMEGVRYFASHYVAESALRIVPTAPEDALPFPASLTLSVSSMPFLNGPLSLTQANAEAAITSASNDLETTSGAAITNPYGRYTPCSFHWSSFSAVSFSVSTPFASRERASFSVWPGFGSMAARMAGSP